MAMKTRDKVIKRYPNGATLIYYRHSTDDTTKAAIGFKTGSRTDGGLYGLTHFLEHMLFHGCKGKTELELAKLTSHYDCKQNAFTGYNFVATSFDCSNQNLRKVVRLNRDILKNRNFDDKLVDQEREVIREEMVRYLDETADSLQNGLQMLLEAAPNKQISILGYEPTIDAIKAKHLIDHANETFVSENLICSVSSSLPFEEIEKIMNQYIMGAFPSNPEAEIHSTLSFYNCNRNYFLQDNESGSQSVQIDVLFKYNGSVQNNMLYSPLESFMFNTMRGRLHEYFRLRNQLCYTAQMGNVDLETLIYKCFQITTSPKKINDCLKVLAEMIDDVKKNGISREEFEEYKNFLKNQKARKPAVHLPVDPAAFMVNYITYDDPFLGTTIKDLASVSYEEANEHIKQVFKDTNLIINIAGEYDKEKVMTRQEALKLFDATTKRKSVKFDLSRIIDMKHFDLYSYVSTQKMTNEERAVVLTLAEYKRGLEEKAQKTSLRHSSSEEFSEDDVIGADKSSVFSK